jgi:hypothetical protein
LSQVIEKAALEMDRRISIDTQHWISQGRETSGFDPAAMTFFTRRLNLQRLIKPARIGLGLQGSPLERVVGSSGAIQGNRSCAK